MNSDSRAKQNLSFDKYPMWYGYSDEISELKKKYPDLREGMGNYFPNNGSVIKPQQLVKLSGTVPVSDKNGLISSISVIIWVPTCYPYEQPDVFVILKPTVIPTQDGEDDDDRKPYLSCIGRVNFRILRDAYKLNHCAEGAEDLEILVDMLVAALSKWPPKNVFPTGQPEFSIEFPLAVTPSSSFTTPLKMEGHVGDITKQLQNFGVVYANLTETLQDVFIARKFIKTFKPGLFNYLHNNRTGSGETLLAVSGNLVIWKNKEIRIGTKAVPPTKSRPGPQLQLPDNRPVLHQVLRFVIPIWMWFPKDYPASAPTVFVKRSKNPPRGSSLTYLSQYGEVDLGDELNWEDVTMEELFDRLEFRLMNNPPMRHVSSEVKSGSDEEFEENDSDSEGEPEEVTGMVPLDAALRLFLSAKKNDECQDVKTKIGELLHAKRERNKIKISILLKEILSLLKNPNFYQDWDQEEDVA